MNNFKLLFSLSFFLLFSAIAIAQIPRTLSYQGILTDNAGKPRPDGDYQFTFCLYDTATGGAPIWTEQKTLPVKGGLFSTILGDATPFGAAVKFDKQYWLGIQVGNEPELSPRIPLTSVGYSLSALRADTAKVAIHSTQGSSDNWTTNGVDVFRLNGKVGVGTATPDQKLHVKDSNYVAIDLDNENSKSSKHLRFKTKGKLRWYIGTSGEETGNNSGTDLFFVRRNDDGSPLGVPFRIYRSSGNVGIENNVGIGTNDPSARVEIVGGPDWTTSHWAKSLKLGNARAIEFNVASNLKFGIGASASGNSLYFFSTTSEGTDAPPKYIMIANNNGLQVSGRTKTNVLEITGGSDLAEPFEISHTDSLLVGSLVVIDPEQPGKLKQATEPYDKRVAGVISGAGGINPGLTLTQEGKLSGSQHVALTGKVYALATTANGTIEPGDLLTTSSVPGHAMKATDHERAFGSVIGKAMSSLKDGEGLVLVLIQPH